MKTGKRPASSRHKKGPLDAARTPLPGLRYWRRERGFTAAALIARLHEQGLLISLNTLYNWENGALVRGVYVPHLATAVGVSEADLRAKVEPRASA